MTSTQEAPARVAPVGPYGIPLDTMRAIRKITPDLYWGRLAAGPLAISERDVVRARKLGPAKVAILSALLAKVVATPNDVTAGIDYLARRSGQAPDTTAAHLRALSANGVLLRVKGARGRVRYTFNPTAFGVKW
jgi:hypothetical protein